MAELKTAKTSVVEFTAPPFHSKLWRGVWFSTMRA
nr:hypothetical protein K4M19_00079 [Agrobacterium fabrum]